ncbi:hypothetical protein D3C79_890320 [compost metagenome]
MVERTLWVQASGQAGSTQQLADPLGQGGVAGGRVLDGVQGRWKATEVMPGVRLRMAGH